MPLDLVVPHLLAPLETRLPALERWLAAARIERVAADFASWLAERFGLPLPAPVAPVALAGETGRAVEGAWLRADPVHLAIGQVGGALQAGASLAIAPEEADALTHALNAHFRDDGLEFIAPAPHRWYLRVPAGELPQTASLDEAYGPDARGSLPGSRGRINWRTTLTEAQMLLAAHDVNARRESRRTPILNSLWLWGGGEGVPAVAAPYAQIHATDPFARGLGVLSGARLQAAPGALDDVSETKGAVMAVLEEGTPEQAEANWFARLGDAMARFGDVRLVLPANAHSLVATLRTPSVFARFRKPPALSSYA